MDSTNNNFSESLLQSSESIVPSTSYSMSASETGFFDSLKEINTYYKDLVQGKVLKNLEIVVVISGGFKNYMESKGKLGGQNKLPRLSNNRKIVDNLIRVKI